MLETARFERELALIANEIADTTARSIAGAVNRLVGVGELRPDAKLPPVRVVASRLGCSPTTVNDAWRMLSRSGAIESRGRAGTFVRPTSRVPGPVRYRRVTQQAATFALDLSTGTPDPELLPDLRRALSRIGRDDLTSSYLDRPVLPELESALRDFLPFEPEALTVVDGALDALDRLASAALRRGDRVIVEACAFPPLLDLLSLLGADLVPVDVDSDGVIPTSLANALGSDPVAAFIQPRAHNPLGASMSAERMRDLVTVLGPAPRLLIVEDDHSGAISTAPAVTLASAIPRQVVHITSFSKSHGPDLRLASVAGPANWIEPLADRRTLGPGWSSRILQAVLAHLLNDRVAVLEVSRARDEYHVRRRTLAAALAERGVETTGSDGINMWVTVDDEQDALVALAADGVAVSPGSPFVVAPDGKDHIRLTVGSVRRDVAALADRVAAAVSPRSARRGR